YGAVGPAGICYARLVGHIGKGAVMVVVEEGAAGLLSGQLHVDIGGVGEVDIRPAIAIVVDDGDPAAHGFDDVFLVGGSEVVEVDLSGSGDVRELGERSGRRCIGALGIEAKSQEGDAQEGAGAADVLGAGGHLTGERAARLAV